MLTRTTAVFVFLLAVATAFDPISSSKWIKNMVHGNRCRCVNLIFNYRLMTAARTVSKILSLSFRASRVLSIEDYVREQGRSDCTTSLNVVVDQKDLQQIKFNNNLREKWIFLVNSNTKTQELFQGIDVSYNSATTLIRPVSNSTNLVQLQYVYRVRKDYPLRVYEFGTIDVDEPITDFYAMPVWKNLEGHHFTAGANIAKPTTFRSKHLQEGSLELIESDSGYIIEVFETLSESLNFKFTTKWYTDPMGTLNNGSWTGLAKFLYEEEIDVLLGAFIMSPERLALADFPGTLLLSRFQVFALPLPTTSTMTTLLKPLDKRVWDMVAFWLILVSLCLFLVLKVRKQFNIDNSPMPTNIAESVYFTTQALCQQAYTFVPSGVSLRIIIFIAYFTANTLVPSYSASLISSLTQRQPISPFRNLEDISKMNSKLIVGEDSEDFKYLANSEDAVMKSLVKNSVLKLQQSIGSVQIEEAYKAALVDMCKNQSRFAIFGDELYLDYVTNGRDLIRCGFVKMSGWQAKLHQSFAFKRNSPYNAAFRLKLLQMRERGMLSKFQHKYWPRQNPNSRLFSEVELSDVSPIFIIFGVGSAIALVIFVFEHLTYKRNISPGPKRHLKRFEYFNQLMLSE